MTKVSELSRGERMKFYRLGYKDKDIQDYLDKEALAENQEQMKQFLDIQQSQINQLASAQSYNQQAEAQDPREMTSMFSYQDSDNLIKWQLELDSILERIEHMLRGDKMVFKQGHMIWKKAENEEDKILNDFGVSEVMRILSMYLNRNTILSNYDETTINWKVLDFGQEISDLFFLKYESMGLDDLEKRKLYPILVRELVDSVHSAYLRALHGGERESLREARTITQTDQINPYGGININTGQQQRERGMLNPMRYLKGKYV